jgi:hypothetical protein
MIHVREAAGDDAPAIREIFLATYGTEYPYPQFYLSASPGRTRPGL